MPDRASIFFAANYFSQGMGGLAYESVNFLLKDTLALGPGQAAAFVGWMTLPFTLKPLFGVITDAVPVGGRRRGPYLVGASLCASAAWALLALRGGASTRGTLALLFAVNAGVAFADVACDALMVQLGRDAGSTGRYQAVQIGTLYACLAVTGIGGGWMAQHLSFRAVFAVSALLPLIAAGSAVLVPDEGSPAPAAGSQALAALGRMLRAREAWLISAIILLWNFLPHQGTSFFYYQAETLGLSKTTIGLVDTLTGLSGAAGAWAFHKLYGRDIRWAARDWSFTTMYLARWSAMAGVPMSLLYLGYRGEAAAIVLSVALGAAAVISKLALLDVVAKSCPKWAEGTSFAGFMALFNVAALASNTAGGMLYARLCEALPSPHWAIAVLAGLGALTTLACLPLLGLLRLDERGPGSRTPSR